MLFIINEYKISFIKSNRNGMLFTRKSFHLGLSWIIPIIGIIGYILAYSNSFGDNKDFKEIVIKVSDVFVIGGFVGFLSSCSQFFGIFSKELECIVFSDRFLESRKDISSIWIKVSKALFNQKFPDISEDLFSIIQNHYICKEEYSYYDNYRIITDIEWADENKTFILVKDFINFDLITEKEGNNDISFSTWMNGVKNLEKDKDYYCKLECKIDNILQKSITEDKFQNDDNEYIITHTTTVHNTKDKGKYQVSIYRERRYVFELDYDISFRAKYIVKDMTISLDIPQDIKATFICRGTTKDFIKVKNDEKRKEYLYKGLILQRQGYTFALHKK